MGGFLREGAAAARRWPTDPRFASNAQRASPRATRCDAIIVGAFSSLTAAQVVERLDAAQIANARVNTMAEVWAHPQLQARDAGARSTRRSGRCRRCCRPAPGTTEPRMDPVPALGQHTDAILAELGLDAAAIAELRTEGAL